jgi:predicted nucleotidyltransferase
MVGVTELKKQIDKADTDRFDLEDKITLMWCTETDIDTLFKYLLDTEADLDTVGNALLGLKVIHTARVTELWDVFTALIHNNAFKNKNELNMLATLQEENRNLARQLEEAYENCESIVRYEGLGPGQSQQGMSLRDQLASAIKLKAKDVLTK